MHYLCAEAGRNIRLSDIFEKAEESNAPIQIVLVVEWKQIIYRNYLENIDKNDLPLNQMSP